MLAITMEFITNQKGSKSLLWNGSRFTINCKIIWTMELSTGDIARETAQQESPHKAPSS
jgi:hypothetical protein